jgi:hypothetical protein
MTSVSKAVSNADFYVFMMGYCCICYPLSTYSSLVATVFIIHTLLNIYINDHLTLCLHSIKSVVAKNSNQII